MDVLTVEPERQREIGGPPANMPADSSRQAEFAIIQILGALVKAPRSLMDAVRVAMGAASLIPIENKKSFLDIGAGHYGTRGTCLLRRPEDCGHECIGGMRCEHFP